MVNILDLITVRNDGDSPAEGMSVSLYDKGKLVGTQDGVTVPAHGTAVVPMTIKASDSHEFTARATSDLYDTGDMATGQPLKTIEEEAALENAGGILGLLALILAVIAIVLIILGKRGGQPEAVEPAVEEIIVDPVLEEEITFNQQPQPLPAPVPPGAPSDEEQAQRPYTHGSR